MARSYAQVHQRIWADPNWRALDVDSQHLYLLFISQPQMNLAGVLPLQLRKWASCVHGWDTAVVADALARLRADHFVVVDEDTEEVLVRTLIRNDGAYKTPGMLVSILRFAEAAQSPSIRSVLAVELAKLPALKGKTAAEGAAAINATRLALAPDGIGEGIADGIGDGIADGIADTFVGTHRGYLPQNASEPIADTSVTVTGSVPRVSPVEILGGESSPTPPRCIRHNQLPEGDEPPCRACKRLRENWEVEESEARKPRPLPPLCGDCDNRWVQPEDDGPAQRCPRCHPQAVAS